MRKKKIHLFDAANVLFMLVLMVIMLYPMYFTVIASLSEPAAVAKGEITLLPKNFTLEAYQYVLKYNKIWVGYANTIINTVLGTLFSLFLTIPAAYVLSKKYLPRRKIFTLFFMICMYFSGGMVPTYLLIKQLGLLDTRAVLILLGGLSIYNLIVTRSFFENSIPESLYEAAHIDGAGEIKSFFSIALPLAKPILAVMILYYAVSRWNNYFDALLYIKDEALLPLQNVLRSVLIVNQQDLTADMINQLSAEEMMDFAKRSQIAYTMRYAVVFIASAPLLAIYPFIQKYFVKGVMIGAVKE